MATHVTTTRHGVETIRPATIAMLKPFFPRWRGDAFDPPLPAPKPAKPAPAAHALVLA